MEERIKIDSGAQFPESTEEERILCHYGTERSDMGNAIILLVATVIFYEQETNFSLIL